MRRILLVLGLLAVLATAFLAVLMAGGDEPARAAFPGANGKIAFTSERDGAPEIYVMNADGSAVTNLTNNPAFDSYAAWSPDGTKIGFASDRDGPMDCFNFFCNFEIYLMNADGSGVTRLTDNATIDLSPAWSPDGSKIAFTSTRDDPFPTSCEPCNFDIYVMSADGSGVTRLTDDPAGDGEAAWSPDGTKIAFTSGRDGNSEVYVMNADGSGQANLSDNLFGDADPAWSPDGTKIAFTSRRDDNWEIYVMNADGSGQTNLTNSPGLFESDVDPAWSPDGTKIAFQTDRPPGNDGEVYVMHADGSDQTNLTDNPAFDFLPDWQPLPTQEPTPTPTATPTVTSAPPTALVPTATRPAATVAAAALPATGSGSGGGSGLPWLIAALVGVGIASAAASGALRLRHW